MPNIGTAVTTCGASPLTLTVSYPTAANCPDGNTCTTVSVVYVTPELIPDTRHLAWATDDHPDGDDATYELGHEEYESSSGFSSRRIAAGGAGHR